jgi:hypothetical protein
MSWPYIVKTMIAAVSLRLRRSIAVTIRRLRQKQKSEAGSRSGMRENFLRCIKELHEELVDFPRLGGPICERDFGLEALMEHGPVIAPTSPIRHRRHIELPSHPKGHNGVRVRGHRENLA